MKVLVIIDRDLFKGSTQYRLAQFTDLFNAHGISLEFIRRNKVAAAARRAGECDLLLNQKCLIRAGLARRLIASSRRTWFDFDDAIYTRPGRPYGPWTSWRVKRRLQTWLRHADLVTTANKVLAGYARRFARSVTIVPMAIDTGRWHPVPKPSDAPVTLGWIGAPVNVPQLERLNAPLRALLRDHPNARLRVFSGRRPVLTCPFDYTPYQPGAEAAFVQQLDIGLLPLEPDEFSFGKSPIKTLQYLACGVPVVGNIFGATAEILSETNSVAVRTEADWIEALTALIGDRPRLRRLGAAGRAFIEQRHDCRRVGAQLLGLLHDREPLPAPLETGTASW
jgi:glycosyltransferase involved in cell wall biosynthesis